MNDRVYMLKVRNSDAIVTLDYQDWLNLKEIQLFIVSGVVMVAERTIEEYLGLSNLFRVKHAPKYDYRRQWYGRD